MIFLWLIPSLKENKICFRNIFLATVSWINCKIQMQRTKCMSIKNRNPKTIHRVDPLCDGWVWFSCTFASPFDSHYLCLFDLYCLWKTKLRMVANFVSVCVTSRLESNLTNAWKPNIKGTKTKRLKDRSIVWWPSWG